MAKIYRTSDRLKVSIDDIEFKISPLTLGQKKEIQALLYKSVSEKDLMSAQDAAILSVKYAVKSVKGLFDSNEEPYQLVLENNNLSEECIDDLLNIEISDKLATVCTSLIYGIGNKIIDPNTGREIEGVSFEETSEKKN